MNTSGLKEKIKVHEIKSAKVNDEMSSLSSIEFKSSEKVTVMKLKVVNSI